MPFPIGQFPRGLLNLLNIQSQGAAPRLLGDEYQATIDVGELFMSQLMVHQIGNDNSPSNGNNPVITIPANEIWKVYSFSAYIDLAAASAGYIAPTVVINSANSLVVGSNTPGVASATIWAPAWNLPITFSAGTQFGAFLSGASGTVSNVGVHLLYTPLRAGG